MSPVEYQQLTTRLFELGELVAQRELALRIPGWPAEGAATVEQRLCDLRAGRDDR